MAENSFPEPGQSRAERIVELGQLSLRSQRDGQRHTISLVGELDLAYAERVEQELVRVEQTDARQILVDLSGLTFIDSSGIRLLLTARDRVGADSGRLVLRRAPDRVQRVLRIAGVDELLPFSD